MSTAELRAKWIQSITKVDDRFLRMIDALYASYTKNEDSLEKSMNDLPQEIQEILMQSREGIKQGSYFFHDEVMTEVKQKFNITK